jgi:hypothetical protein
MSVPQAPLLSAFGLLCSLTLAACGGDISRVTHTGIGTCSYPDFSSYPTSTTVSFPQPCGDYMPTGGLYMCTDSRANLDTILNWITSGAQND